MTSEKEGDLRIVLLGKTGAGKSASGNTILGRNVFKETSKICEKHEGDVDGKNTVVFDTPGLFNASITKEQVKSEIERCVEMSAPGPHVFLLVIKLGVRFTEEERNSVQWIQENFGEEALLRTIILFTHVDLLKGRSLEEYIRKSHYLPQVVNSFGGRYHSFNNEDKNNQKQVTKLLQKINGIIREQGTKQDTPVIFKTTKTEITGKDKMNLRKFPYTLCATVLIGGILLGVWHLKQQNQQLTDELKVKEEKLKNEMQMTLQLTDELKVKEEALKNQTQMTLQLTDELKVKGEELKNQTQMTLQLTDELKLKEEELKNQTQMTLQLTDELKVKEEKLKNEMQMTLQLTDELKVKEEKLKNEMQMTLQLTDELKVKEEELKNQTQMTLQLTDELKVKEEELKNETQMTLQLTDELKVKEEALKNQTQMTLQLTDELKVKEEELKNQTQMTLQLTDELKLKEEELKNETQMTLQLTDELKVKEEELKNQTQMTLQLTDKLKLKEEELQNKTQKTPTDK